MRPYWQSSDRRLVIYHGDCRAIMSEIQADVLVTDPPYGVGLGSGRDRRPDHVLVHDAYASYEDSAENFDAVVVPAIQGALSMAARGAVFCAGHRAWRLPPPDAIGGIFLPSATGRTCWGFNSFAHCLLYGTAPDLQNGARPIGIRSTAHAAPNGHPCPKPLSWMQWAVSLVSRPDERILDPFMGSGTTLLAAMGLGRRAVGIEIEERYCEIAAKRLEDPPLLAAIQAEQAALWDERDNEAS